MINKQTGIRLSLLVLLLFMSSCYKNIDKECKQLRNGHFMWKYKNKVVSVYRKDSIQIERQIGTNKYDKVNIRWIDDCHYELKILSSTFSASDSVRKNRKSDVLIIEILKVTKDYYLYECTSKILNSSIIDTMWIKE